MSLSKIKQPSDLWERSEGKLMVYIMEGISLVTTKGAGNPYVKLTYDKQKQKTQVLKGAEDATWRELFLFEITDDSLDVTVEVWTKAGLSEKLIGTCRVCSPQELATEELIDRVIDLEVPSTTKAKHKEALDSRIGNIHLRLLYSREREIPIRPPPNASSNFFYRNHYRNMKTGDLIVYSGVGSTDAICKLISGTRYSRVGLVLRLPNKWTGVEKLYVYEISRNLSRELDAFQETPHQGASIYRLFDHLHAVAATNIWWVPLKAALEPASCENMLDWIKDTVSRKSDVELPAVKPEVFDFFERYEMSLGKHPYAIAEICSATPVLAALKLGGKRISFEQNNYVNVVHFMSADCFGDPILLRERSDTPMPPMQVENAVKNTTLRRGTVTAGDHNGAEPARSRPVSMMPDELPRTPTQVALQRPDGLQHSFASQHNLNAPADGQPTHDAFGKPVGPAQHSRPVSEQYMAPPVAHSHPPEEPLAYNRLSVNGPPPAYTATGSSPKSQGGLSAGHSPSHGGLENGHSPTRGGLETASQGSHSPQHTPRHEDAHGDSYGMSFSDEPRHTETEVHEPVPEVHEPPAQEHETHEPTPAIAVVAEAPPPAVVAAAAPPVTAPKPKKRAPTQRKQADLPPSEAPPEPAPKPVVHIDHAEPVHPPAHHRDPSDRPRLLPAPSGRDVSVVHAHDTHGTHPTIPVEENPAIIVTPKKKKKKVKAEGEADPSGESKKKKKKIRNEATLAPADALDEQLPENTKVELRKRRVGSVRILPTSEATKYSPTQPFAALAEAAPVPKEETPAQPAATAPVEAPSQPSATSPAATSTKTALVLWDFEALAEIELDCKAGDKVIVLELSGEWAQCNKDGVVGAIPVSFLSMEE